MQVDSFRVVHLSKICNSALLLGGLPNLTEIVKVASKEVERDFCMSAFVPHLFYRLDFVLLQTWPLIPPWIWIVLMIAAA